MKKIINEIFSNENNLIKIGISEPIKTTEYSKIISRPVVIKNQPTWQAERFAGDKVFHLNLQKDELCSYLFNTVNGLYRQINLFFTDKNVTYYFAKNDKFKRNETLLKECVKKPDTMHDRQKDFIIKEGEKIPALIDLGVFTSDYKIVKAKYEKYRQINRFVEIIDDAFKSFGSGKHNKSLKIIDFGCGKSYLTFIVYYYFNFIKQIDAEIVGYDLKAEVVENCNKIAQKYGYHNLHFIKSDVKNNEEFDKDADMVICLHACDVATDYALYYAIKNNVKNIFSVPCCQHEVNLSIKNGGEFDLFLKHGLIKERFCALLTDSVRTEILQDFGYKTDVIEYIDSEHSLKNVMLRAKLVRKPDMKNAEKLREIINKYSIRQTLYSLLYN